MIKLLRSKVFAAQAAFVVGMLGQASAAHAQAGGNDFSTIAANISSSIQELPGLLASVAYMVGLLMGVLGIIKIKDHVENPTQTPMKDGAVRLAAGGALFALPILFESMQNTIGLTTKSVAPAQLAPATFTLLP